MEKHHLEDLTEMYLLEKNISASTIKSYKIVFKKYIEYLKRENITYPRTSDVIRYRNLMKEQGYSTYYVYIHISALKGLYLYLKMNQERFNLDSRYRYDLMVDIKNERIKPNIKKKVLTPIEAKQLLLYTKDNRSLFGTIETTPSSI
jgi:site-specific recombinase XerD